MACSGPGASPTASGDHIHIPPKEWVHGKSRSLHSSSHRHKHTQERATHDTAQSSLHQHHPTSHASPYPLPVLPKQSVAKSDTFCSKSLACCNLFPPLG